MFKSTHILINEHGIDVLKHQQIKEHIDYKHIDSVTFYKGHVLKNWFLSLAISISFINICIIWIANSIIQYNTETALNLSAATDLFFSFILPFLILAGNSVWLRFSLRLGPKLLIKTKEQDYRIALMEFEKENTLSDLISFINNRTTLYNYI